MKLLTPRTNEDTQSNALTIKYDKYILQLIRAARR